PPTRCALTAPFHPYPPSPFGLRWASREGLPSESREACGGGRYVFCATFRQVSLPGSYPAHRPVEFGLSSRFALSSDGGRSHDGPVTEAEARKRAIVWLTATSHYQIPQPKSQNQLGLPVDFLPDSVLLELLIEIAARG